MTHYELLAKIDEYFAYGRINDTLAKALRAVVEVFDKGFDFSCEGCMRGFDSARDKVFQAIEKELK